MKNSRVGEEEEEGEHIHGEYRMDFPREGMVTGILDYRSCMDLMHIPHRTQSSGVPESIRQYPFHVSSGENTGL